MSPDVTPVGNQVANRNTRVDIYPRGATSLDFTIDFTPKPTGQPVRYRYPRGRIFLLTDLSLIREWILPSERAEYRGASGISLIFPPLAGKHPKVSVPDSGQ